jgi:hypothetical protein
MPLWKRMDAALTRRVSPAAANAANSALCRPSPGRGLRQSGGGSGETGPGKSPKPRSRWADVAAGLTPARCWRCYVMLLKPAERNRPPHADPPRKALPPTGRPRRVPER